MKKYIMSFLLFASCITFAENILVKKANEHFQYGEYQDAHDLYDIFIKGCMEPLEKLIVVRTNDAQCLIACGIDTNDSKQFVQGWQDFDFRLYIEDKTSKKPVQDLINRWEGQNVDGKTIVVHHECGIGDSAGFGRYLAVLKKAGARVIFRVPGFLKDLFSRLDGIDEVVSSRDPMPDGDYDTYLLSLPRYVSSTGLKPTTLDTIPSVGEAYLHPNEEVVASWKKRLSSERLAIGIWWRCSINPVAGGTRIIDRNVPLAILVKALMDIDGIELYDLSGPGHEAIHKSDFERLKAEGKFEKVDRPELNVIPDDAPEITKVYDKSGSFSDTTAFLSVANLNVGVDTSIANISGALNAPTRILMKTKKDSDMRWGTEGESSVWFGDNFKMYRQEEAGDTEEAWAPVMEKVRKDILELREQKLGY